MASSSQNTSSNYQQVPLSSFLNFSQQPPSPPSVVPPPNSTSLFDPHLPSYLPTFRSSSNEYPSPSSLQLQPPPPPPPPPPPGQVPITRPNACNSKKRSRASRRAPTTVLTTDTTNFRAMVQEFTGFPAPPFPSPSPPFPLLRPRLHLITSPSPPYTAPLPRPFPQKIPAATPNSSLVDAIHANITSGYPFVNHSSLIGGPLNIAPPQFGDLGSLIAASQAMQVLPSWAADRQQELRESSSSRDHQDESTSIPEHEFQPGKRQKTTDGGMVGSWIHSSD